MTERTRAELVADDWMQTSLGIAFRPLTPDPDLIDGFDIAHALGMLCRYNGHCSRFYSVAEHCVLISEAVSPENALWGLLHDATEAYVGDMVRPLKRSGRMQAYIDAEDAVMRAICDRFGLPHECPAEVHEADLRILNDERIALMAPPPLPWVSSELVPPLGVTIDGWSPDEAGRRYLRRLNELCTEVAR